LFREREVVSGPSFHRRFVERLEEMRFRLLHQLRGKQIALLVGLGL